MNSALSLLGGPVPKSVAKAAAPDRRNFAMLNEGVAQTDPYFELQLGEDVVFHEAQYLLGFRFGAL